jgi:hypothetical protein
MPSLRTMAMKPNPSCAWSRRLACGRSRQVVSGLDHAARDHDLEAILDQPVQIDDLILGHVVHEARRRVRRVRDEHHLGFLADLPLQLRARAPGDEPDPPQPRMRPRHQDDLAEDVLLLVGEECFPERLGGAIQNTDARNTGQHPVPHADQRATTDPRGREPDDDQQQQGGEHADPGNALVVERGEPEVAAEQVVDPVEQAKEHPQRQRGRTEHEEPGQEVGAQAPHDADADAALGLGVGFHGVGMWPL